MSGTDQRSGEAAAALLEIVDLTVGYGPIEALRDVSLSVDEGQIYAVLGPNGAGKTTLLRSIAGALAPSRGSIRFRGQSIGSVRPEVVVGRGISLVPEGRKIFPDLTVEENLQIGAITRRDRAEIQGDIDAMFEMFPVLGARRGQRAGTLSGGEQQQLAISRALMSRPSLMLLDEPSLGLAPIIMDRVFELLVQLRDRGVTLLVVEQNVHRALAIADAVSVLAYGQAILSGSGSEIRAQESRLEQAYLGLAAR